MKFYGYQGCSTCKNALKWLKARGINFQEIPIRETPPTLSELTAMLKAQEDQLRPLFNTAGQDYRALGMKDKLPQMTAEDALKLLSQTGNLVKRPFVIDEAKSIYLLGFHESTWSKAFS
jgi:arsenate reductase